MSRTYLSDLRQYIDVLRKLGETVEVPVEVDWNLEMGAIIRGCYELGAPAPLFTRIKGIEPGFRAFGAPAGTSRQTGLYLCRVALSLGPSSNLVRPGDRRSAGLRAQGCADSAADCAEWAVQAK